MTDILSYPLITSNEVRKFLGQNVDIVEPPGCTNVLRAVLAAQLATTLIEAYTGRYFTLQEHTELLNSRKNTRSMVGLRSGSFSESKNVKYYLAGYPLDDTQYFSVNFDDSRYFSDVTELHEDDFILNARKGSLIVLSPTYDAPSALQVIYTAGYEYATDPDTSEVTLSAAIPVDLKTAAIIAALFIYKKLDQEFIGVTTATATGPNTVPGYFTDPKTVLPPEIYPILNKYKKLR